MRVAAFDVGSDEALVIVAELRGDLLVEVVDLRAPIASAHDHGATVSAIERLIAAIRAHGVGAETTIVRAGAGDGGARAALLGPVCSVLGGEVELADAARVGALTFAGAAAQIAGSGERIAVIDVQGDTTDVVIGAADGRRVEWAHSYELGAARLTERLLPTDPPLPAQRDAVDAALAHAFARARPPASSSPIVALATGPIATAYAAIDGQARGGEPPTELDVARLEQLTAFLARLPLAVRKRVPGIDADQARTLVAGGLLLAAAARACGATVIRVRSWGARHGLARERLSTWARGR